MKQLDEMERMARWIAPDDLHPPFENEDDVRVARAFLAVMPVVRAVVELHESDYVNATMGGGIRVEDRDLYAKLAAVYDAIDEMRRRLGGE